MTTLIEQVFLASYGSQDFTGDDSATLFLGSHRLAFTTDSFVVDPLFFILVLKPPAWERNFTQSSCFGMAKP